MNEFLHMGGYAAFVWSSYGLTAATMAGLAVWAWRSQKAARARVERLEARVTDG